MESLASENIFFINGKVYNDTESGMEAVLEIEDKESILQDRRNWQVTVSRFSLSGQRSLYYYPAKPHAGTTVRCFAMSTAAGLREVSSYQIGFDKTSWTISDFLTQLNPPVTDNRVYVKTEVDGSGRYTMKLENKLTVKPPHTTYYAEIQFSEVMANALGFQQIPRNISYNKTSKEQLKSAIDWATDALRSLELNIIQATDEGESPARAFYYLTELGEGLRDIICPTIEIGTLNTGNTIGTMDLQGKSPALAAHIKSYFTQDDYMWVVNEDGLQVSDDDGEPISMINIAKELSINAIANQHITFEESLIGDEDDSRTVTPLRKMASPVIRVQVTIAPSEEDDKTTIQFTNAGAVYPTIIPGSRLLVSFQDHWQAEYEIIKIVEEDVDSNGDIRWEVQVDDEIQGDVDVGDYLHVTTMSAPFITDSDSGQNFDEYITLDSRPTCIEGDSIYIASHYDRVDPYGVYVGKVLDVRYISDPDMLEDGLPYWIIDLESTVPENLRSEETQEDVFGFRAFYIFWAGERGKTMYKTWAKEIKHSVASDTISQASTAMRMITEWSLTQIEGHEVFASLGGHPVLTIGRSHENVSSADLPPVNYVDPNTRRLANLDTSTVGEYFGDVVKLGSAHPYFWWVGVGDSDIALLDFLQREQLESYIRFPFGVELDTHISINRGFSFEISQFDLVNKRIIFGVTDRDLIDHARSNAVHMNRAAHAEDNIVFEIFGGPTSRLSSLLQVNQSELNITVGGEARIYETDMIKSSSSAQVDTTAHFSKINLVSHDLQQQAERDYSRSSRVPILTSFQLPSMYQANCKPNGEVVGFSSQPYGQIQFVESAVRKFHRLLGQFPMRAFSITAQAETKNREKSPETVILPPGGLFELQLCLMKKE